MTLWTLSLCFVWAEECLAICLSSWCVEMVNMLLKSCKGCLIFLTQNKLALYFCFEVKLSQHLICIKLKPPSSTLLAYCIYSSLRRPPTFHLPCGFTTKMRNREKGRHRQQIQYRPTADPLQTRYRHRTVGVTCSVNHLCCFMLVIINLHISGFVKVLCCKLCLF